MASQKGIGERPAKSMASYDLSEMTEPMANSASTTIALPIGGAFLLQSALMHMDQRWQWVDGNDPVSDNDWDELEAQIAALMLAIMQDVEDFMSIPVGFCLPLAGTTASENWLLCDGSSHLRVDYPDLYAALDASFITDADNFVVPDAARKFITGLASGELTEIGEVGGSDETYLTIANLPAHHHLISLRAGTPQPVPTILAGTMGSADALVDSLNTGGDVAHDNLPPYLAMPYYIRAK